ncbi:MAG: TolC family protein [Chlorobi bacterium]|nr:TolC family protein [Chlorobiota bacterium]
MEKYFVGLIVASGLVIAQDSLTLQEAVSLASRDNIRAVESRVEVLKAKKKVWETTAIGFPQVSLAGSYQYFLELPLTPVPARIFNPLAPEDQYIYMRFGQEQKMEGKIQVSQLIFNGSYIVGLQSARTYERISQLAEKKTVQVLTDAVTEAYVNLLLTERLISLMDSSISIAQKQLDELNALYQQGLIDSFTVVEVAHRIELLRLERDNLIQRRVVATQMLNIILGRDPQNPLFLKSTLEQLLKPFIADSSFNPEKHIDYLIAQNSVRASKLQVKYVQSQALPTVSAFWMGSKYAYATKDFDFFNSGKEWQWQSLVGLQISFPIITGGRRTFQMQQKLYDYNLAVLKAQERKKQLAVEFKKLYNDYKYAYKKFIWHNKQTEISLQAMERDFTRLKTGLGSSSEFLNSQRAYFTELQNYYISLANLILAQEKLINFKKDNTNEESR